MKATDKMSLYDVCVEGFEKKRAQDEQNEKLKQGIWRGGSSGCLTETGSVIGADPREVVLRFLGIQVRTDYDTQLMFDAGLQNEESFADLLAESGIDFKREEEIPMKYELDTGELVTGRPDVVILDKDKPTLGIELKLICSPWSAADKATWFKANADNKHVVQACHYSSFFDIPWVLAYTNRGMYAMPFYAQKNEDKHILYPEHRAIGRDEKNKPFIMKPFQSFYDITLDDDGDTFLLDGEPTRITKSGIKAFYEYCSNCIINKEIPMKRSGGLDHFGQPLKKNKTLAYYDFKGENTNGTFDEWVKSCREIAENT